MTAQKIPTWIERLLLPKLSEISGELKEIRGELKAINTRIDSTDAKVGSLRNETKIEISSLRTEMIVRLDSLEKRMPVIEKLTAMEIKIADLERRFVAAEA